VHHIFPSRLVPILPAIRDYAAQSFSPGRPVLAGGVDLMARIKADFAYDPTATDVTTPTADAFALKRGVCQDFAHVMIAGLRALGLPAAYVSGYLRTEPAPGQPRLEGADASHAWVSLWCDDAAGWQGIDPTNGVRTGIDHIALAIGRDYADVAPVDGVIVASGGHSLEVSVDVTPLPA
jgi:transglutaminase-like putative cysteine protease